MKKSFSGVGNEQAHYTQCPDCEEWFDMQDLRQVFSHQHWLAEKPKRIESSHVTQRGKSKEFYIKSDSRIITLRLLNGGSHPPPENRA